MPVATRIVLVLLAAVCGMGCSRRTEGRPDAVADPGPAAQAGTAWGPLSWGMSDEEVSRALGPEQHGVLDRISVLAVGTPQEQTYIGKLHIFARGDWSGSALVSPSAGLVDVQLHMNVLPGEDDDANSELLEVCGMPRDGARQTGETITETWSLGPTTVAFNRLTEFRKPPEADRVYVSEEWTNVAFLVGQSLASMTPPDGGSASDTGARFDGVSGWIELPWGTSIAAARSALTAAGYAVESNEVAIPVARSDGPDRLDRGLSFVGRGRTGRLQFVEGHGLARAELRASSVSHHDAQAWGERVHALLGDADQAKLENTLVWATPTTKVTLTAGPDLPAHVQYVPAMQDGGTAGAGP